MKGREGGKSCEKDSDDEGDVGRMDVGGSRDDALDFGSPFETAAIRERTRRRETKRASLLLV